jgi:acyl-CoA thioester hydrolase
VVVETTYRVIYGDTDQMGVVYYANYLRFFEIGRNEYLRAKGMTYREIEARGLYLPVVSASLRYKRPARYDDLLTVRTRIISARGARVKFSYEIVDEEGGLLVDGETQNANTDKGGKVMRLPPDIIELLEPEEG